jgi:hypothetical protein
VLLGWSEFLGWMVVEAGRWTGSAEVLQVLVGTPTLKPVLVIPQSAAEAKL